MSLEHHWTVVWKNKSHVWSLQHMSFWSLIRSISNKDIKDDLVAVCSNKRLPMELGSSNGAVLLSGDKHAVVGYETRWCFFSLEAGREIGSSVSEFPRVHKKGDLQCWFGAYDSVLKGSLMAVREGLDLWYGAVGYRLGEFNLNRVGNALYVDNSDPVFLLQSYVEQGIPEDFLTKETPTDLRFSRLGVIF